MANTAWPGPDRRRLIGSRTSRLDGPNKATGTAKYAYDMNLPGMLVAKMLQSPHANATVLSVDTSKAEKLAGVRAVVVERDKKGNLPEVRYAGATIATLAADTEEIAIEAIKSIKVKYEVGKPQMIDTDPNLTSGREQKKDEGDVEAGFRESDIISEGEYGISAITHCCLEAHGQVVETKGDHIYVWPSTQNVSGYAGGLTRATKVPKENIHVDCQYMGGGFGAKFAPDRWGAICAELSQKSGKPVKLMLDRDQEIKIAGARPSAYAKIKVGLKKDGTIHAWEADVWGSGGMQRFRMPPIPYVFKKIPNYKLLGRGTIVNRGLTRAWRGPNHPQAALLTMAALEDAAAAAKIDTLEFFKKNLHLTDMPDVYAEELDKAADMIGYKKKAHLRGDTSSGPVKRGIGMSIHTWGGQGHASNCSVTLNPDGTVGVQIGTQDLGTGTRTIITMVVADSLGITMSKVHLEMGKNDYPTSGASGGSTTVGGVCSAARDASVQALNALLDKVAPELGATPAELEAWDGKVAEIAKPSNSISWEEACKAMGQMSITKLGSNPTSDGTKLTTGGVGGCQMADVSVDIETGIVTMNEFVSVQDCGLVIDFKTCESQMYGGAIMGITYALYEEVIYDVTTGAMLNPDMEFYRLAGLGDIGELKVHLMTGPKYESRGVIGIGEPAVLSAGAAISNAVANAIGLRVPHLPLTPDRVLDALEKGGVVG